MKIYRIAYLSVVAAYIIFGIAGGWQDIFPGYAVFIAVLIIVIEVGMYFSTRNK